MSHQTVFYGNIHPTDTMWDTLRFYWTRRRLRRDKRVIELTPKSGAFHFNDLWGHSGMLTGYRGKFPEGTVIHERFAGSDSTFSNVLIEFADATDMLLFKIAR